MRFTELIYKLRKSLLLAVLSLFVGLVFSSFLTVDSDNKVSFKIPFTKVNLPFVQNKILSDLIPGIVGSIAVYWVLDETIKQVFGISEIPDLPLEQFIQDIKSAQGRNIYILETFTKLATEDKLFWEFSEAIKKALKDGSKVQLLFIHPDSDAARQRAEELSKVIPPVNVPESIEKTLARFYQLEIESNNPNKLQIKLYDATPTIAMHRWGEEAYVSFFPVNKRSDEAPNLKLSTVTTFGRYCVKKFEELWTKDSGIYLNSYMKLKIKEQGNTEVTCYYVYEQNSKRQFVYAVPQKSQAGSLSNLFTLSQDQLISVEVEENRYDAVFEYQKSQKLNNVGDDERGKKKDEIIKRYFWKEEDINKYITSEPQILAIKFLLQVEIELSQNRLTQPEDREFYYVYEDNNSRNSLYAVCNSNNFISALQQQGGQLKQVSVIFARKIISQGTCNILHDLDQKNKVIKLIIRKYEQRGLNLKPQIIDDNSQIIYIKLST
ncbi:hypothetical protein A6770_33965 [Nostoc minutum NIES-26]|uniref:Uncharacterized protein n=1 Tax=Nostoc minutum NIES-26 TaxID=1844469 RepID=A0A367Q117_9NOSO|nr:hypothetical protein A6770_33965 [Nostoc minutum NIES-26]